MHAPARRSDALREALLECRLAVLVGELDVPLAARVLLRQRGQTFPNGGEIRVGKQLLGVQHLGVRDGRARVVFHEAFVEREVLARRVREYAFVERRALVPESTHSSQLYLPICCSAALRALTSATINVPAPSFVNTSARMPSGDL